MNSLLPLINCLLFTAVAKRNDRLMNKRVAKQRDSRGHRSLFTVKYGYDLIAIRQRKTVDVI